MARGSGRDDAARAAASRPAARSRKKSSAPASRASSPTCSTASSPTCTSAPSRSASATCCACRCGWCATSIEAEAVGEERRIGVLYLDSREKGSLLSNSTRAALETLATEAAVAIENARLYRETMEKARMEQEMRIAAEIQQALLPEGRPQRASSSRPRRRRCRAARSAATSTTTSTCRTASLGFALGDVAGKGPPAALLSAMMQGIFAAQAASSDPPSQTISARQPGALPPRHRVAVRDADVRRALSGRPAALLQRRPQSAAGRRRRRTSGGSSAAGRSSGCSRARPTRRRRSR